MRVIVFSMVIPRRTVTDRQRLIGYSDPFADSAKVLIETFEADDSIDVLKGLTAAFRTVRQLQIGGSRGNSIEK
jgi:hypothetical protein